MSEFAELECHPASRREQLQAYENVFPVWAYGETVEEHVAKRLESVQHNRARWYVGCLGERVVTSLGCYPMRFLVHGQRVEGIAIGAVHTIPECRRQGFAAKLISRVEEFSARQGCQLSLLFSDIPSAYYARLGYVACPALEGWIPIERTVAPGSSRLELVPFDPMSELDRLKTLYANLHQPLAVSIERDDEYWRHLLQKWPANRFSWAVDASGEIKGYVGLAAVKSRLKWTDFAIGTDDEADLIAAVLNKAGSEETEMMGGWLPNSPAFAKVFPLTPRTMEMTMFKFLDSQKRIDLEMQQDGSRIHEIDHV